MKWIGWIVRFVKCLGMMYLAFMVFLFATFWILPADESGAVAAPDWYALLAMGISFVSAACYWGVLKRREGKKKAPWDWKLMWKSIGLFFFTSMLFAIVVESMYPGYSAGGVDAPRWTEGGIIGVPTIVTGAYICCYKIRKALDTRREETPVPVREQPAATEAPEPPRQTIRADRRALYLHQLRRSNDAIPGEEVSAQIDRMVRTLGRIFDWVEDHPESEADLKQLMDYYLPMTMKLLDTYADMDELNMEGENIRTSKREIEGTLADLNRAYEKLLDDLVADTALDVSSDISVLKAMLAREGLTEDELTRMRRQRGLD